MEYCTTINEANFNLNHGLELRTIHEIDCPMTLRTFMSETSGYCLGVPGAEPRSGHTNGMYVCKLVLKVSKTRKQIVSP